MSLLLQRMIGEYQWRRLEDSSCQTDGNAITQQT